MPGDPYPTTEPRPSALFLLHYALCLRGPSPTTLPPSIGIPWSHWGEWASWTAWKEGK